MSDALDAHIARIEESNARRERERRARQQQEGKPDGR